MEATSLMVLKNRKLKLYLLEKQSQIFNLSNNGDVEAMVSAQNLLLNDGLALEKSIKKITKVNKGRKTSGIDKKLYKSEKAKQVLINIVKKLLKNNFKSYIATPVKRVFIPKKASDKLRPIGIPTILDRVLQNLVKMGLEPEWEASFQQNSFGFRPAIGLNHSSNSLKRYLKKHQNKRLFLLKVDIESCFDNIDHNHILTHIKNPIFKKLIKKWLKAGILVKKGLQTNKESKNTTNNGIKAISIRAKAVNPKFKAKLYGKRVKVKAQANKTKIQGKITGNTKATKLKANKIRLTEIKKGFELIKPKVGTPQGGVISPLLSNIALHHIDVFFSTNLKNLYYQRFADDLLFIHDDLEVLETVKPKMVELLAIAGLKINASKTSIQAVQRSNGLEVLEEKNGSVYKNSFSSLGYDYYLGFDKIRVTPSLESQNKLIKNITLIWTNPKLNFEKKFLATNQKLLGYGSMYRFCNCSKVFRILDFKVHQIIIQYIKAQGLNIKSFIQSHYLKAIPCIYNNKNNMYILKLKWIEPVKQNFEITNNFNIYTLPNYESLKQFARKKLVKNTVWKLAQENWENYLAY